MFLESLAKHIIETKGESLLRECFVFPNRRSGLFFKRFLIRHAKGTQWTPRIVTINELMQELSGMMSADPLDMLFELYTIYKELALLPESFDDFYPWGEMMLSDFDTLDKYLVDPGSVFRNIKELKEIDEKFGGLEEEQIEFIRKFWKSFHQGDMSKEKDVFLSTWKLLPKLYFTLKKRLEEKGEAYEGMIYKSVSEMEMNALADKLQSDYYTFVGFNALSSSEKKLFSRFKNRNIASFFWDYDETYLLDPSMEAGRFLRDNIVQFPPPVDLGVFKALRSEKQIRIFDLPSDILQAKTVFRILSEEDVAIESAEDTAIIACDENLLMPILVSLPDRVDLVNITMGYPFKNTPLNSFVDSILRLHKNARANKGGLLRYYYKDVLSVLNHQYYKLVNDESPDSYIQKIVHENRVYIAQDFFKSESDKVIFSEVSTVERMCSYLEELMHFILRKLNQEEEHQYRELEKEYILVLLSRLNKLEKITRKQADIELQTFMRLFRKIMANQRIPFTGEPLAGLQIMGILETRLLDFKNVIMLSVNEDVMPKSSRGHSFIPYSLRYAYGLPTHEEMDAIYAYYFYRVIQRAEKVDLIFKSASEGVRSGEMSRYLYQMKYDFDAKMIRPVLQLGGAEKIPIVVHKTPDILNILGKYIDTSEENSYFSPSSLNTYIECSLKFYFRKIANIREQDELLEELDPIGFGNILHNTIHALYDEVSKGKRILSKEELKKMHSGDKLDTLLRTTFIKEYFKSDKTREIEGRNLIIFAILKKYLQKIIEYDAAIAPIEILDLEQDYEIVRDITVGNQNMQVRLGGKIDRMDRISDGVTRIIDYKTGNTELGFESIESLFDPENSTRNKEAFQAMLYASLYHYGNEGETVQPGLYIVRKMFGEKYSSTLSMGSARQRIELNSVNEYFEEFNKYLDDVLSEIYNPDLPFKQTEIVDRCKYCDFNGICARS